MLFKAALTFFLGILLFVPAIAFADEEVPLPDNITPPPVDTPTELEVAAEGKDADCLNKPLGFDSGDNCVGLTSSKRIDFLAGGVDPLSITINITRTALGLLGLASFLVMLYAGYLWFSARDNEEKVERAKDMILGSVIGLVIVLSSLGISYYVFGILANVTTIESDAIYEQQLGQ